jgi:hypothetical protein
MQCAGFSIPLDCLGERFDGPLEEVGKFNESIRIASGFYDAALFAHGAARNEDLVGRSRNLVIVKIPLGFTGGLGRRQPHDSLVLVQPLAQAACDIRERFHASYSVAHVFFSRSIGHGHPSILPRGMPTVNQISTLSNGS